MASASASPRCVDGEKMALRGIPTLPATTIDGVLVRGAAFHLECRLKRVIDDLAEDRLLIGEIVAAHAAKEALRSGDTPDGRLVHERPLLAYLHPSRFATIDQSTGFPFPKDFTRS